MIVYLQTILIVNFWIYIITKTDSMLAFSADLYMPDNLRLLQSWVFYSNWSFSSSLSYQNGKLTLLQQWIPKGRWWDWSSENMTSQRWLILTRKLPFNPCIYSLWTFFLEGLKLFAFRGCISKYIALFISMKRKEESRPFRGSKKLPFKG
jgi:hypothetical protein